MFFCRFNRYANLFYLLKDITVCFAVKTRPVTKSFILAILLWKLNEKTPEYIEKKKTVLQASPTEIWTRIVGFRVQSAYHYTMEPAQYRSLFE